MRCMKNSRDDKANPKTPLARRLRKARREAGYETINEFVNKNGFELSAYTLHELGHRNPRPDTLKRYARILGKSVQYLEEGKEGPLLPDEFDLVSSYDVKAAAGHGNVIAKENIKHTLSFRHAWLKSLTTAPANKLAIIEVSGDSMEPTLSDGDTVLIDMTQADPQHEGVYFIQLDEYGLIKRLQYNPQKRAIRLVSDNKNYDPIEVSKPDSFKVIGRALWTGRRL